MEKISIISLIFQSTEYAEFVYESVMKYTDEIDTGDAEFYFVANDATDEVLDFLKEKNYPHFINNNVRRSEDELYRMGFAYPEYITRVYQGYNFGIKQSNNPIITLINSDMSFSPDWLINLMKRLTLEVAVSPKIIQPNHSFKNPINGSLCEHYEFGQTIKTFKEDAFLLKAEELKDDSISTGNLFMPVMLYKENIEKVGYYPEGNLNFGAYRRILRTGDEDFFIKLNAIGVKHINSNDSIVYHFNEGEKDNKI